MSIIAPPPNAQILAFRKTNSYPKPGSIISVNSSIIEKYIKDVENSRDSEEKMYAKILPKLTSLDKSKLSFFYITHIEATYNFQHSDMLLYVDSIEEVRKQMMVKCYVQSLYWPSDVEHEKRFIYFEDFSVNVVEPVICHREHLYSDKAPNNKTTFGLPVTLHGQKLWHIFRYMQDVTSKEISSAIEIGFKEFSYITLISPPKISPPVELPIEQESNHIQQSVIDYQDFNNDLEEDFDFHPLQDFVEHIYTKTCMLMQAHGLIPTDEFRKALRETYIKSSLDTCINITPPDDE